MPQPELLRDEATRTFAAPWEAQIFAIVVKLQEDGHFAWKDFADSLSAVITEKRAEDDGSGYYRYWLEAALRLLAARGLVEGAALVASIRDVEAHRAADHGHVAQTEPIFVEKGAA